VVSAEPVDLYHGLTHWLTVDEVEALEANGLYNVELLNGRLLLTPIGDIEHQHLSLVLANTLLASLPDGLMVLTGVNVYEGNYVKVIPDVVVIDPELSVRDGKGVSPDGLILAIEITSPSNRGTDLVEKRDQYEAWGVPYLLIDRKCSPHRYTVFGNWPTWAAGLDVEDKAEVRAAIAEARGE
jgi:Uma2 family endonuclease